MALHRKILDTTLRDSTRGQVFFGPTGGADDWPALQTLMTAEAAGAKRDIVLVPGTYTCNTRGLVPSGTVIRMSPDVLINSTMPWFDNHRNCVFTTTDQCAGAPTTTTNGDVAIGATSVTLTSAAAFVVGSYISLNANGYRISALVTNVVGAVVTLDQPLWKPIPNGSPVFLVTPIRNVRIYGNGARIYGTGDRFIQMVGTWDCHIEGLIVETDPAAAATVNFAVSYDLGGRNNTFRDIKILSHLKCGVGVALEGQVNGHILNCSAQDSSLYGFFLNSSYHCALDDCRSVTSSNSGLYVAGDDATDVYGCIECMVSKFSSDDAPYGVLVQDGSYGNSFDGIHASRGQYGVVLNAAGAASTAPLRNTFAGVSVQACTEAAFAQDGGVAGTIVNGITMLNCPKGGIVVNGTGGDLTVRGLRFESLTMDNAGSVVAIGGTGTLRVTDVIGSLGRNGTCYFGYVTGAGKLFVADFNVTRVQGGAGFFVVAPTVAATIELQNGVTTGSFTSGSLYNDAGILRLLGRVEYPSTVTGACNRGTVTLNGVTPVDYSYSAVKATSMVRLTRKTAGGTAQSALPPTYTITAGNKVSVVSATADANDVFEIEID